MSKTKRIDWGKGITIGGTYTVQAGGGLVDVRAMLDIGAVNPKTGKRTSEDTRVVAVTPLYARQLAAALTKAADAAEMKPEGRRLSGPTGR